MKSYKELLSTLQESEPKQGKVETKKYSWGTMKTVHHGADFSIPLHPEHHHAISKLKDEQEHKFKDETGRHWVARRKGEHVHFDTTGNGSMKTHVPMHTMKEEYENVELDEETHSELARQAASKYRTALARGDSVAAAQANAERVRHKKAAQLARQKSHVPGEMDEETTAYWKKPSWQKKMADAAKRERLAREKKEAEQKQVKEEVLEEGKMGQIHADIEDHLGKHLADYKTHGGAEHFANKVMKTHEHIAKLHGLEKKHAASLVNSYVDSKLHESQDHHELGIDHDEPISRREHIMNTIKKHGGKISGQSDKSTYVHFPADKVHAAKAELKAGRVHASHWVNGEFKEETIKEAVQDLDKYFAGIEMKGGEPKKTVTKKEPENKITGSQIKFFNNFKEELELSEKMNLAKADMGDVIKDFQQSDAPQFAGKSKEKRKEMAIAAKLQADRQQNEAVIQPTGDDRMDTGADNKGKTTYTKDKTGKIVSFKHEGEWKKATKKDPRGKVTHMSDVAQRQAAKLANEEHAPVAPVPDRKYIKGTPEWKAHKEKSKPINGHPTNVKEEAELEEAFINGREYASQGVMHPDHAKLHKVGDSRDFYAHGTGDKISGKVTKNDGKEVHIQADKTSGGKTHKFTVTPHLPKPVNEGSDHDPYFAAQKHKSDAEKAHKAGDHKSYHMFMAAHHDSMAEWSAQRGRHHVAAQHEGKAQNHEDWANQTHKEEVLINDEGDFVVENKLTYNEFMSQLLEYTPGPGGVTRVQGRSYGAQYHDPEGDDDADDKPAKKAEPAAKRGRGRPAGSKSGANVKRLSSKGSNGYGYDSTGYKLHLPNTNK